MITIRKKLLLYFLVFVVLFNVVSYSIYVSSRQLVNEYHKSFQGFLLLNEISQQSAALYEGVNSYAIEREKGSLEKVKAAQMVLLENKERIEATNTADIQPESMNMYQEMMDTLVEESDKTIQAIQVEAVDEYPGHLREVRNVSGYVQEATLAYLNLELNEYQQFYDQMEKRNTAFKHFIISLFVSTLLLAVFMALWFSRGITKPIHTLTKAAAEMSAGRLDGPDVSVLTRDEIHQLGESFNQMRRDMRRFIEEIKEKAALNQWLKELELKQLQNQINPHFLFNTLNTVKQMSYLEDAPMTTQLIESVSSLLRYSLGDLQKSVTLADEMAAVESYFAIQKTRFSDRVSFHLSVEEQCLPISMPALILQPIVENAFIHGIENREEGGEISVVVTSSCTQAVIEVKDNGAGIDEKTLQKLRAGGKAAEHTGHSTGIGLENVIKRLHLFYKEKGSFSISSTEGMGTTVQIRIPFYEGRGIG
ncbi:sensor histidine kinase [Domibacillus sp. PGB-M46]|uniref:sensor histidine kinase n=1 Tax=Domibacillus sp. PGB-M46 TaxID=2910255 RepID=UPI001F59F355|nr:sensor histidine kinase [Domibacillus sp. PGB-M46]MCI2255356.1 sensor histidine kinase [Domibacillus sp. PGB-M46]